MNVRSVWSVNLTRNMAGLLIIMSLLPILLMAFEFTAKLPFEYDEVFDELSLMQLRESLLIAYDLEFTEDCLYFDLHNRDFTLSKVNDKLIMQPGTQIFLSDLQEMHFEVRNNVIYVCYEKDHLCYERVIASANGFYIDRFSDCDVCDEFADRSEG